MVMYFKLEYKRYINGGRLSLCIGTPPFDLELVTEKQINTLLDVSKISIPVITYKCRAVDDPGTSLKKIMETAKKERENAAKVPELKKQNVQKEAEDGSVVVEERISEFYYFVLEKRFDWDVFFGQEMCYCVSYFRKSLQWIHK